MGVKNIKYKIKKCRKGRIGIDHYVKFNTYKLMELKNECVFRVNESLIKDKMEIDKETEKVTEEYNLTFDFAEDCKIYYIYDKKNEMYIKIDIKDYDKYDSVFKLVSFTKDRYNKRYYYFRFEKYKN